jgi:hypothetical protein
LKQATEKRKNRATASKVDNFFKKLVVSNYRNIGYDFFFIDLRIISIIASGLVAFIIALAANFFYWK